LLLVGPVDPEAEVAKVLSANDHGFQVSLASSAEDAAKQLKVAAWCVLVSALENARDVFLLLEVSRRMRSTFCIVYNREIVQDCKLRLECYAAGAQMLANEPGAVLQGLRQVARQYTDPGRFTCHICGLQGMGENALHLHLPLYHSMQPDSNSRPPFCVVCEKPVRSLSKSNFYVHLHNEHGPPEAREPVFPAFNAFAWVVCRRPSDGRFLMVHEPAGLCGGEPLYWLPAGRVDGGETFMEAGVRETLEEGGVACIVKGVLQFLLGKHIVPRIVLYAEACGDAEAKSVPDFESCGALWVDPRSLERITGDDCRSPDPLVLYPAVASGSMKPQSIETASFAALERMVKSLTAQKEVDSASLLETVGEVWAQLRAEYPQSCFSPCC